MAVFLTTFFGISILMISLKWKAQKKDREKLEEERKKIEKQMEFWDNYYNNNEEEKKEDEKIPTSYKSYDDEEEIKKEIDKIKPIVKNSDDIEGLKKREKKINSVIKNFNFDELDEEALIEILTEPKNALTKQYEYLFEMEGVKLTFETDALHAVAKQAMKRKTGARGLRSIIENALLDTMYELPSMQGVSEVIVTKAVIENGDAPITK